MRITVTLARQFGCGGSYLGQCVAESLGVRCLDREILSHAAQRLSAEEEDLAAREERGRPFWERMLRGISVGPPEALYHPPVTLSVSDRDIFQAETEVMKSIAAREDCVIVGRLASHVLPDHPGMVNVFLHAPLWFPRPAPGRDRPGRGRGVGAGGDRPVGRDAAPLHHPDARRGLGECQGLSPVPGHQRPAPARSGRDADGFRAPQNGAGVRAGVSRRACSSG